MLQPRSPRGLRVLLSLAALALIAPLVVSSVSCSLIGYTVGRIVDEVAPPKPRLVPAGKAVTVVPGTPMVLLAGDSVLVRGAFRGVSTLPDEVYGANYVRWQGAASQDLCRLSLGDEVDLVRPSWGASDSVLTRSRGTRWLFQGFTTRGIVLEAQHRRSSRRTVPFKGIGALVSGDGGGWSRTAIEQAVLANQVPLRDALLVEPEKWTTESGMDELRHRAPRQRIHPRREPMAVPFDQVTGVRLPGIGRATPILTIAGALVDVGALVVVATYDEPLLDFGGGCDAGGGSWGVRTPEVAPGVAVTDRDFDTLLGEFVDPDAPSAAATAERFQPLVTPQEP
jgi:hypothetical protein